jgi:hypothetical protein
MKVNFSLANPTVEEDSFMLHMLPTSTGLIIVKI